MTSARYLRLMMSSQTRRRKVAYIARHFYNDREPAWVYRGPQRPFLARDDPNPISPASLPTEPSPDDDVVPHALDTSPR
jgi:hypothetical protein